MKIKDLDAANALTKTRRDLLSEMLVIEHVMEGEQGPSDGAVVEIGVKSYRGGGSRSGWKTSTRRVERRSAVFEWPMDIDVVLQLAYSLKAAEIREVEAKLAALGVDLTPGPKSVEEVED